MRKKCWSRARQSREAGQKSWLRGGLSNKVSVKFTFPHFHIILLHFSADSWVLFYWLVWTLRIIGLFFWIYLFAYMLCLILSWFPWRLLYVVDALLHPWTWYIRIMFVFFVNPTCSLAHGCHLKWGSLYSFSAWFPFLFLLSLLCSYLFFFSLFPYFW